MADSDLRIFLWMTPRSISTALEKLIAHMDGAMVWHEPYLAAYFKKIFTNPLIFEKFPKMKTFFAQFQRAVKMVDSVKHEYEGGNLESISNFTYEYIGEQLEKPLQRGKKFMLVKDAALGIDGHYDQLPKVPFKHTFLIRHPNRTAPSAQKLFTIIFEQKGPPEEFDIGPGQHPFLEWDLLSADPLYKLWNFVRENIDPNPVVIDADDLQNHTGDIMRKYCAAVGIPWDDKYLSFGSETGFVKFMHGSIEQIVWGRNEGIYSAAFESSEIKPTSTDIPEEIPVGSKEYVAEFREGYQVMYQHRLKPDQV